MPRIVLGVLGALLGFAATGSALACDPAKAPYGYIGSRYSSLGGEGSQFGCPTTPEMDATGKGRVQYFEFGGITWSPNTGQSAVQTSVIESGRIRTTWQGMDPSDFFLVRIDLNGQNIDQHENEPDPGGGSGWSADNIVSEGQYRIYIEGCTKGGLFGSSKCKGWSNPIELLVTRDTACAAYARFTLAQINRIVPKTGTNYCTGPRWSTQYNDHVSWCRTAKWEWLRSEADQREGQHQFCYLGPQKCQIVPVPDPSAPTGFSYTTKCNY